MASDMVNLVLDAEKQSAENETAARNKAENIVKAAENEAKAILEAGKASAAAEAGEIVKKAKEKSEETLRKANDKAEKSNATLIEESKAKTDAAVKAVINRIIP